MYMIICVRMYHRRGARDIEKQQPGIAEVIADEPNVPRCISFGSAVGGERHFDASNMIGK